MSKLSAEDNGMTVFLTHAGWKECGQSELQYAEGAKAQSKRTTVKHEVANPGWWTALFRDNLIWCRESVDVKWTAGSDQMHLWGYRHGCVPPGGHDPLLRQKSSASFPSHGKHRASVTCRSTQWMLLGCGLISYHFLQSQRPNSWPGCWCRVTSVHQGQWCVPSLPLPVGTARCGCGCLIRLWSWGVKPHSPFTILF